MISKIICFFKGHDGINMKRGMHDTFGPVHVWKCARCRHEYCTLTT